MNQDADKSQTDTSNAQKKNEDASRSEESNEEGAGSEKGRDVKDLLKKARRRGIAQKGQQGVIEFDYPRKKK